MKTATQEEKALCDFKAKIEVATGRAPLEREIAAFREQVEVAAAHQQPRVVQLGLCDFQTLDGRATIIEVSF
ncbi:hypothetical protein EFK68_03180 [Pseudomonas aeruginosa]|uniref:hypothetical protein n=1 Tax=Pseudomonas aeruginosa TaxID=287 RepID=UPI000F6AAF51|nr:hypothetical protein [Pseudomonas aeruginosa]MDS9917788.1 hypothetical protein [Pseudomonas aeruginosa]RNF58406.1 hypothetical protein EFK68_03180 [Pseudomonas aeruginosa]